jgi:hypothetical protein
MSKTRMVDCGCAMDDTCSRCHNTRLVPSPPGEPIQDQPPPVPNAGRPIWELVIDDMKARDQTGQQRYGTPLQAFNGRDPLIDAYQEALDLCVYLRQAIEERKQG